MPLAITDRTILMSGAGLVGATQSGFSSRLSAADARTLLGLSTANSPSFSGMTLSGHLLFNATNTYDIGNGTYDPRTVRAATSVLTPLLNNTNAAALILGNSGYGLRSPGNIVIGSNVASGPFLLLSEALDSNRFGIAHKYGPSSWTSGCDSNWMTGEVRVGGFIASYYPVIYSGGNAVLSFTTGGTATFTGTVRTPTVDNSGSQLTLTGGPDAGYFNTEGVVLRTASSATAYCRAGAGILYLHQTGLGPGYLYQRSNGNLELVNQTTNGDIDFLTYGASGYVNIYNNTHDGVLRVGVIENGASQPITLGNATYGVTVPGNAVVGAGASANSLTINSSFYRQILLKLSGTDRGYISADATNCFVAASAGGIAQLSIANATGSATFAGGAVFGDNVSFTGGAAESPVTINTTLYPQLTLKYGGSITGYIESNTTNCFVAKNSAAGTLLVINNSSGAATFSGSLTPSGGIVYPVNTWLTSSDSANRLFFSTTSQTVYGSGSAVNTCHSFRKSNNNIIAEIGTTGIDAWDTGQATYTRMTHNSTDGVLSTFTGNLYLVPAGGTTGVTGALTTTGDISMSKTSAQGYIRAYETAGVKNTALYHDGTNGILSTSSGALVLNPATSIIGIGGITSSFPAIKRSSTTAAFRLGDDSADAPISCAGITASNTVTVNKTSGPQFLALGNGNRAHYALGRTVEEAALGIVGVGGQFILIAVPADVCLTSNGTIRFGVEATGVQTASISTAGTISFTGGLTTGFVTKTANYTTTAADYTVCVTANTIDITLETAVGCAGRIHVIQNSGSGVVTLKTTSSQTISGNASGSLTLSQWDSMTVQSDGANWIII